MNGAYNLTSQTIGGLADIENLRIGIADNRTCRLLPRKLAALLSHRVRRRSHKWTMKCSRRVQAGTALAQGLPRLFGSLDGGHIARHHYLAWCVVVGTHQYFVLGTGIADALRVFMSGTQQRIHRARALLAGLRHRASSHIE